MLFFAMHSVNIHFVYIYSTFFLIVSILDCSSLIKIQLPFILSLSSEMRNIQLLKNSGLSFRKLLHSKISLLRLLMAIPTLIICIQLLLLKFILPEFSIYILFINLAITILFLFLSPIFQMYGDTFFSKYDYKSYAELYEKRMDSLVHKKFFTIPRNILIIPLGFVISLSCFIEFPNSIYSITMACMFIYLIVASLMLYMFTNIIIKKGEIYLDGKILKLY